MRDFYQKASRRTEFLVSSPGKGQKIKDFLPRKINIFHCCLHSCITSPSVFLPSNINAQQHGEEEKNPATASSLVVFSVNAKKNKRRQLTSMLVGRRCEEETETRKALSNIRQKQQDLINNFKLLREKYDDIKNELHLILWEFIPTQQADDLTGFSDLGQVNHAIFQSPDRIGSYVIGSSLGEGQFSIVKLCTHNVTSKQYAVKIIQKNKISTLSGLKRVGTEVKLLQDLRHPNIIKFVDYIHSPTCIYIFTEVGGQDLYEYFQANPTGAGVDTTKQIILGIVKPLLYLHSRGICHRDLKPENILLCESSTDKQNMIQYQNVRLCDFGQSAIMTNNRNTTTAGQLYGLCGSPGFFAPEMILGGDEKPYNGFSADVWSVGCIMLELSIGHEKFCNLWMKSYDYEILKDETKFQKSLYKSVSKLKRSKDATNDKGSKDMNLFLQSLLVIDPKLRLNASQMLNHKWFDGFER